MFHAGDLPSGIALALQESKSVACFIADDSAESVEWETHFLAEKEIATLLKNRAVTLRLQVDSQEAAYLKAYYPVDGAPSMVIIQCGLAHVFLRFLMANDFVAMGSSFLISNQMYDKQNLSLLS